MILVLSPAKRLNVNRTNDVCDYSIPAYIDESNQIMHQLKKVDKRDIEQLMGISKALAETTCERIQNWHSEFSFSNSHQAIFSFNGDVYHGLNANSFSKGDLDFAQSHLRILSGLHGVLKPLDLIRPYRLEMGTKIKINRKKDLYEFWGSKITESLLHDFNKEPDPVLINLASQEYFRSIHIGQLKARIITPVFKEYKNGEYKIVQFWTKKARGYMAAYIIKNKLQDSEQIKLFETDGYYFNTNMSNEGEWVFTRG